MTFEFYQLKTVKFGRCDRTNNTQITFDNGTDPFLATIVSIDSENVKLTGNVNSLTATLELERI